MKTNFRHRKLKDGSTEIVAVFPDDGFVDVKNMIYSQTLGEVLEHRSCIQHDMLPIPPRGVLHEMKEEFKKHLAEETDYAIEEVTEYMSVKGSLLAKIWLESNSMVTFAEKVKKNGIDSINKESILIRDIPRRLLDISIHIEEIEKQFGDENWSNDNMKSLSAKLKNEAEKSKESPFDWFKKQLADGSIFEELSYITEKVRSENAVFRGLEDDVVYEVHGRNDRIAKNSTGKEIKDFVIGMHQQYGIDAPKTHDEIIEWLLGEGISVTKPIDEPSSFRIDSVLSEDNSEQPKNTPSPR